MFSIDYKIFGPEARINFFSGNAQYTKKLWYTLCHCCCSWTQDSFKFLEICQGVKMRTECRNMSKKALSFQLKGFANKNCVFFSIQCNTENLNNFKVSHSCSYKQEACIFFSVYTLSKGKKRTNFFWDTLYYVYFLGLER